jgi:hypothetical protein
VGEQTHRAHLHGKATVRWDLRPVPRQGRTWPDAPPDQRPENPIELRRRIATSVIVSRRFAISRGLFADSRHHARARIPV